MDFTEGTCSVWLKGNIPFAELIQQWVLVLTQTHWGALLKSLTRFSIFFLHTGFSGSPFMSPTVLSSQHLLWLPWVLEERLTSFNGSHRPQWPTMHIYPAWASFTSIISGDHSDSCTGGMMHWKSGPSTPACGIKYKGNTWVVPPQLFLHWAGYTWLSFLSVQVILKCHILLTLHESICCILFLFLFFLLILWIQKWNCLI